MIEGDEDYALFLRQLKKITALQDEIKELKDEIKELKDEIEELKLDIRRRNEKAI